ncbi:MAG TPA: hypothetical protein VF954_07420 [Acidimicrobiales bacterium]
MEPTQADRDDQGGTRPALAWLIGTGEGGRHFDKFLGHEMAAVDFRRVGDATGLTKWELAAQLRGGKQRVPPERLAEALREFVDGMAEGDYVFAGDGRGHVLVGLVTGPYRWQQRPPLANFNHTRSIHWLGGFALDELPDPVRMPVLHNQGSIHRFADQPAALAWCRLAEEGQGAPVPRVRAGPAGRGRPPTRRSPSAESSSPTRTRASRPASPPAAERRLCSVCFSSLPTAHFDQGSTACRSCAAMDR